MVSMVCRYFFFFAHTSRPASNTLPCFDGVEGGKDRKKKTKWMA